MMILDSVVLYLYLCFVCSVVVGCLVGWLVVCLFGWLVINA